MTTVPLPERPVVRCALVYTYNGTNQGGSRFYLSYSGSAPTGANCATLAADIAGSWNVRLAGRIFSGFSLTEVDVLDIATNTGLSGQWSGTHAGSMAGAEPVASAAQNVEFGIGRRYRGGKPRMYLPPPDDTALANLSTYNTTQLTDTNSGILSFFQDLEALSIGSMGTLAHVNVSYYEGFTNVTNSSGRIHAAPKYRAVAKVDTVTGYFAKAVVGSQRRRRTSTTP